MQPNVKLHNLGHRAFRPVVQRVRHVTTALDSTEVQDQLISTVDVHVPPNIDQVPILAVYSHRGEITGRSLHGLVMLPALVFAARADAERHDVELHDVLKQELWKSPNVSILDTHGTIPHAATSTRSPSTTPRT